MKYKMWFDSEYDVARIEVYDVFDAETGKAFFDEYRNKFSADQQRFFLANVHEPAQKMVDKETRKVMAEGTKGINWEKMAIIGAKSSLRMVMKIIITAIGKAKLAQFFDNENDALAWLKAERDAAEKKASA